MFAAPIWHWWIGLVLLVAGGGAALGLIFGYLRTVSRQRFPSGRRNAEQEL